MSRALKLAAGLLAAGLLCECAPASRVILLPDSSGRRVAVEVKTATTSQVLSAPYETASVSRSGDLSFGTTDPQALLPTVVARALARQGGELVVVAHTDRFGSVQANDALSLQRANAVRELFVAQGFNPALVEAVGRGERAPMVATEDEVAEPQNRRAEIIVR